VSKPTLEVCYSPVSYPLFHKDDAIVVVIDILRATSAMCTAFHFGAAGIIPVATVEEALKYKERGYLAAAERNAMIVDGFDFGNSPYSYMTDSINGKTIAITTTNGTQAIDVARNAAVVAIGSFLNFSVLCDWLEKQEKDIVLLCAGWKNRFNLEDTLFAGAVARRLLETLKFENACDSTLTATLLYEKAEKDLYGFLGESSHRKRLEKLDLERDIKYCLQMDRCPVIPVLQGTTLKNILPS
jgi:2-phosphosulfolactate phosphatase